MSTIKNTVNKTESDNGMRYILLTQGLQNDFFLNIECKLRLPDDEVKKMLIGKGGPQLEVSSGGGRIKLGKGFPDNGPLGMFLESVIGRRNREEDGQGILHVINIRDWHEYSPSYDVERRKYGAHCEKGSWGANYIEGLEKYLDPENNKHSSSMVESQFWTKGSVRVYHIYSDSIFDFKPRFESNNPLQDKRKFPVTKLENILDVIILGTDDQVNELAQILESTNPENELRSLAQKANETTNSLPKIYAAMIGVYTDIKVMSLLMGLCSRYDVPNLAVSDTLTTSSSLEYHLKALDFIHKMLNVEIIHGLNNLIRFLGNSPNIENELKLVASDPFSDYVSFFQDKQNVLSYDAKKLQEYLELTQQRALNVYQTITRSNKFLIVWGMIFLTLTLVGGILSAFGIVDWKLSALTGGLSLLQLISAFFSRPIAELQKNLTNLATFRMILESHSLKTALARFHLTTPQTLRDNIVSELSNKQVEALEKQIAAIERIEEHDRRALKDLGFGIGETDQKLLEHEDK